jgi:FixJ family two-component response regulator
MADAKKPIAFVVDEESIISLTLAMILNTSGFDATGFVSAHKALEQALSGRPNLLITDVVMPEMNGIELAIKFKSACPECKILLFSGQHATTNLLKDAAERGHDFHILAKPVHPKELIAALKNL